MKSRALITAILTALVSPIALATPVLLLCETKAVTRDGYTSPESGESYQIAFDEAASTVTVDGDNAVKAAITATLMEWGDYSTGGAWHIDRLTGTWPPRAFDVKSPVFSAALQY